MTQPPSPRTRAGRPTREQAESRLNALLDTALDHFFDKGFERATIEAIAAAVNMTKRTVYARFPDKASLFRVAVLRAVEMLAVPPGRLEAMRVDTLEQTLANVVWFRLDQVMTPAGLKLQRILSAESFHFPDIFMVSYERGILPVMHFIAELFREENQAGRLVIEDPELAANIFVSMAISAPVRVFVSGNTMARTEIDKRVNYAIRIFLDGTRPRAG